EVGDFGDWDVGASADTNSYGVRDRREAFGIEGDSFERVNAWSGRAPSHAERFGCTGSYSLVVCVEIHPGNCAVRGLGRGADRDPLTWGEGGCICGRGECNRGLDDVHPNRSCGSCVPAIGDSVLEVVASIGIEQWGVLHGFFVRRDGDSAVTGSNTEDG